MKLKNINKITIVILTAALAGCATIPPETGALSAEVEISIADSKSKHLALLDQYQEERKARVEDFMRYQWTPTFIRKFLAKIPFAKNVCKAKGRDRAYEVQEVTEEISRQTEKKRRVLMAAVSSTVRALRRGLRKHYDRISLMSSTITANLRSAAKDEKFRAKVLGAIKEKVPFGDKIEAATKKLDDLLILED